MRCGTCVGVSDYTKLKVWEKAHLLALDVYSLSLQLPDDERYGFQSQMRRAAVSIPTNLAKGSGRSTDRDYARFVSNAIGSASELEYQLILTKDLGYLKSTAQTPQGSFWSKFAACCARSDAISSSRARDSLLVTLDSRLATGNSNSIGSNLKPS